MPVDYQQSDREGYEEVCGGFVPSRDRTSRKTPVWTWRYVAPHSRVVLFELQQRSEFGPARNPHPAVNGFAVILRGVLGDAERVRETRHRPAEQQAP